MLSSFKKPVAHSTGAAFFDSLTYIFINSAEMWGQIQNILYSEKETREQFTIVLSLFRESVAPQSSATLHTEINYFLIISLRYWHRLKHNLRDCAMHENSEELSTETVQ